MAKVTSGAPIYSKLQSSNIDSSSSWEACYLLLLFMLLCADTNGNGDAVMLMVESVRLLMVMTLLVLNTISGRCYFINSDD